MSFFSFLILEYYFFSSLRFLSDPIVSLSEPSTHSILICITYPIVKLPILYVHWSTTYLHIIWAVFFSPFLAFFFFFCLLAFSMFDRFNSLFNRRLANVPFFFPFNILQLSILGWHPSFPRFQLFFVLDLSDLLSFYLIVPPFISFSFSFLPNPFCAKIVHFPKSSLRCIHAFMTHPKCLVLHIFFGLLVCIIHHPSTLLSAASPYNQSPTLRATSIRTHTTLSTNPS